MKQLQAEQLVSRRIAESISVKQRILGDLALLITVERVALQMAEALRAGHKVFFMGNGGSAADAQHLTAELMGRYLRDRAPLAAIALNVNTSSLTAIGNDYSFDLVFARQLQALGNSGDIAVGLSTSGNSTNVVRAMESAREKRMTTVALTGASGGRLKMAVDYCICVPSDETSHIQEAHITLGHILCEIIEDELFG